MINSLQTINSLNPIFISDIQNKDENKNSPNFIKKKCLEKKECHTDKNNQDISTTKLVLTTATITALDYNLTPEISKIVVNRWGFCLGNFTSNWGIGLLSSIVNPLVQLNNRLGNLFGSSIAGKVFIPAMCEEIEFRWIVQEILLRKLPKKVCDRFSPKLTQLVDSTPARISRIAATSLIFAFCHVHALDCSNGGGIPELIGGVLYGVVSECTPLSLIGSINLHCIYNLLTL